MENQFDFAMTMVKGKIWAERKATWALIQTHPCYKHLNENTSKGKNAMIKEAVSSFFSLRLSIFVADITETEIGLFFPSKFLHLEDDKTEFVTKLEAGENLAMFNAHRWEELKALVAAGAEGLAGNVAKL